MVYKWSEGFLSDGKKKKKEREKVRVMVISQIVRLGTECFRDAGDGGTIKTDPLVGSGVWFVWNTGTRSIVVSRRKLNI